MNNITVTNWNYCKKAQGNQEASINMGALPDRDLFYTVNLIENEVKELSAVEFNSLNEACFFMNQTYADWETKDLSASESSKSDSGCSSCSAH